MAVWGIKYSDVDDKWWVDLVLQDKAPKVRRETVGGQALTDGFDTVDGQFLARKASIPPTALSDWPADTPVELAPLGN